MLLLAVAIVICFSVLGLPPGQFVCFVSVFLAEDLESNGRREANFVYRKIQQQQNYADWLMVPGNHSKAILCLVKFYVQNVFFVWVSLSLHLWVLCEGVFLAFLTLCPIKVIDTWSNFHLLF